MSKKQKRIKRNEEKEKLKKRLEFLLLEGNSDSKETDQLNLKIREIEEIEESERSETLATEMSNVSMDSDEEEMEETRTQPESEESDPLQVTLDAYDRVQQLVPDIYRVCTPPPVHGATKSKEPSYFSIIDNRNIIVKYGRDPKATVFNLYEYDEYEIAPSTGWLSPKHRSAFHMFLKKQVEIQDEGEAERAPPREIRDPQPGDEVLSSRLKQLEIVNLMMLLCPEKEYDYGAIKRIAVPAKHYKIPYAVYTFYVEKKREIWVKSEYKDPDGKYCEAYPEEIHIYGHGKPGPVYGWDSDPVLELFEKWLRQQIQEKNISDIDVKKNFKRTADMITRGCNHLGLPVPLLLPNLGPAPIRMDKGRSDAEEKRMREEEANAQNYIKFKPTNIVLSPTRSRASSSSSKDEVKPTYDALGFPIAASDSSSTSDNDNEEIEQKEENQEKTSNFQEVMPIRYDEETKKSAIRFLNSIVTERAKWIEKNPEGREAKIDPNDPMWQATLHDVSVLMQNMFDAHKKETNKLHEEIQVLKAQMQSIMEMRQGEVMNREVIRNPQRADEMEEENPPIVESVGIKPRGRQIHRGRPTIRERKDRIRYERSDRRKRIVRQETRVLDSIVTAPHVVTRDFSPPLRRAQFKRMFNWDGSYIDPNNMWNTSTKLISELVMEDHGSGPLKPNYSGADYEYVRRGIITEATQKTAVYPPLGLDDPTWGSIKWGHNKPDFCLCCYGAHATRKCFIFPLASDRRYLFQLRGVCFRCRTRHPKYQANCPPSKKGGYMTCMNSDPGLACEGLPLHHSIWCSAHPEDQEIRSQMIDLYEFDSDYYDESDDEYEDYSEDDL